MGHSSVIVCYCLNLYVFLSSWNIGKNFWVPHSYTNMYKHVQFTLIRQLICLIILPRSYSYVINKGIRYIFQVIAALHTLKHLYRLKLNRPIISGIQNLPLLLSNMSRLLRKNKDILTAYNFISLISSLDISNLMCHAAVSCKARMQYCSLLVGHQSPLQRLAWKVRLDYL
jgi:hypothetical protein